MVGPVSDEERARTLLWMKVGLAILVGVSAGLITSQGEASLEVILGAVGAGLIVGAALAWYLVPNVEEVAPASNRRYGK